MSRPVPALAPLLIATVAGAIGCEALQPEKVDDPESVVQPATIIRDRNIDLVKNDVRAQVVDAVNVGTSRFVIGYVRSDGFLLYTSYTKNGTEEQAPFVAGSPVGWLRANTSKNLLWNGCGLGGKGGNVGLFAVRQADQIYLNEHKFCDTWRTIRSTHIAQANGATAVASKGSYNSGKALVVYSRSNTLFGRFVTFRAGASHLLGTEFIITIGGTRSVDLIYNTSSDRWIVGFTRSGGGLPCAVGNARVADGSPPVVETVQNFGSCDQDVGGHQTSVAYNSSIGDGTYAWWREGPNRLKAVWIHDSMGNLTGHPAFPTAIDNDNPPTGRYDFTVPVTSTFSSGTPYTFLKTDGIFGQSSDKSWSLVDGVQSPGWLLALRGLASETVVLWGANHDVDSLKLMLTISDQP